MFLAIISIILFLLALLGFFFIYLPIRLGMALEKSGFKIGKCLYIEIPEDEVIDYSKIETHRNNRDGSYNPWFTVWEKTERKKLVDYMKVNNFRIKPGLYKFNQSASFELVVNKLQFEKLNG